MIELKTTGPLYDRSYGQQTHLKLIGCVIQANVRPIEQTVHRYKKHFRLYPSLLLQILQA